MKNTSWIAVLSVLTFACGSGNSGGVADTLQTEQSDPQVPVKTDTVPVTSDAGAPDVLSRVDARVEPVEPDAGSSASDAGNLAVFPDTGNTTITFDAGHQVDAGNAGTDAGSGVSEASTVNTDAAPSVKVTCSGNTSPFAFGVPVTWTYQVSDGQVCAAINGNLAGDAGLGCAPCPINVQDNEPQCAVDVPGPFDGWTSHFTYNPTTQVVFLDATYTGQPVSMHSFALSCQ